MDRNTYIFFANEKGRDGVPCPFRLSVITRKIFYFQKTTAWPVETSARSPNDFASVNRKIEILDCLKSMFFNIKSFNFENRF